MTRSHIPGGTATSSVCSRRRTQRAGRSSSACLTRRTRERGPWTASATTRAERGRTEDAIERWTRALPDTDELPRDAHERLIRLGREQLEAAGFPEARLGVEVPRFARMAKFLCDWEAERRATGFRPVAIETDGEMVLNVPAGPFTLTGRADRIDMRPDGALDIIDYKTGDTSRNPDKQHRDNDGLPDAVETDTGRYGFSLDQGSDPLDWDTDGDGVIDGDDGYVLDPCCFEGIPEDLNRQADPGGVVFVGLDDFLIFLATYGRTDADPAFHPDADFVADGVIDDLDLQALEAAFGASALP